MTMKIEKNSSNSAVVVALQNVRQHPNADRLKLATVLGTQVIVGLESAEGDPAIYFDSNLKLSTPFLYANNLFSNPELNQDKTKKGYFGKNGKVKAQRFRGEMSNGLVLPLISLLPFCFKTNEWNELKIGDEFTHINGFSICEKFVVPRISTYHPQAKKIPVAYFWRHWDTKQVMRELHTIPDDTLLYIEEKIHGSSGRTSHLLCDTHPKWYQFWKPKQEWKVISGTRRVDDINYHIPQIREEIEKSLINQLHKGEQLYYEIFGYDNTKEIQAGFPYGCEIGEYRVLLYRVTLTTPDGFCIDLDRESVYQRAKQLGFIPPRLLAVASAKEVFDKETKTFKHPYQQLLGGYSSLDTETLQEGLIFWFRDATNRWTNLKLKSEEFLLFESQNNEEIGDVEDTL